MSNETCPHCGAEKDDKSEGGLTTFVCWTVFNTNEGVIFRRSFDCYERQLVAKAAEIGRLKQVMLDENRHCSDIADQLGTFGYDGHKIAKAIRARGEVK